MNRHLSELQSTIDTIAHRGPDDKGEYHSDRGDCYLGHVRLSILDLSKLGHQPMADSSGRYVITYNGEIYNFRELREELNNRFGLIRWKSKSDTEVIVEGFARAGISFLDKLNGIFSIVIYDSVEGDLYVIRDPLGIKPLFVAEQRGVFLCSEIKGLLSLPFLNRTLRRRSLAEQLSFMYVPEPHTMYEEILTVKPGVCFQYRNGNLINSTVLFSHLEAKLNITSEDEAICLFRETFSKSVKRQLVADVPVSLFLSGGLDSSAIAYETVKAGADIRDAYTIAFSKGDRRLDEQGDDQYYADLMARELGLELKVIVAARDFVPMMVDLAPFMEDGFSDPAAINTYLICAGARKDGIKVMLSGQGADEYLGGYRRYLAEKILRSVPGPLRSVVAFLSGVIPEQVPGRFNALNRRVKRLARLAGQGTRARIIGMYTWATPKSIAQLFDDPSIVDGIEEDFLNVFDSYNDSDIVDAMMHVDHEYDLKSLNLNYTDRMSMAVGMEVRVPFLDFELVRVMNSIPSDMKIVRLQGKYILKKAMKPFLPREIVYREKAGFGLPIRAWMAGQNDMLEHYLDRHRIIRQGILDPTAIKTILDEQLQGKRDHSYTLWALLTQQIWMDHAEIR